MLFVVIVWDFFENAPKWCDLRDQDAHFDLDMIEFKKKKKRVSEVGGIIKLSLPNLMMQVEEQQQQVHQQLVLRLAPACHPQHRPLALQQLQQALGFLPRLVLTPLF